MARKKPKIRADLSKRTVKNTSGRTDNQNPVWLFTKIDRNGDFAFDINSLSFNHKDFLQKVIDYSNMTWQDISQQTHDKSKSKHHYLDFGKLSKTAQQRFLQLKLENYSDSIFSFAFSNKLRIIGIRDREKFYVLWYDSEHKAYISQKKHT